MISRTVGVLFSSRPQSTINFQRRVTSLFSLHFPSVLMNWLGSTPTHLHSSSASRKEVDLKTLLPQIAAFFNVQEHIAKTLLWRCYINNQGCGLLLLYGRWSMTGLVVRVERPPRHMRERASEWVRPPLPPPDSTLVVATLAVMCATPLLLKQLRQKKTLLFINCLLKTRPHPLVCLEGVFFYRPLLLMLGNKCVDNKTKQNKQRMLGHYPILSPHAATTQLVLKRQLACQGVGRQCLSTVKD